MNDETVFLLSHLFSLRLWRVETPDGRSEWLGKLQYVPSGESCYFRSWPALISGLCALLPQPARAPHGAPAFPSPPAE
jgi:hypothetical protein